MQIKTTIIRMGIIKKSTKNKCWRRCGERKLSCTVGGNINWYSHYGEQNAAAAAKSLQSCPTLCYLIDSSPPGSPVPGILQARTLEWVAISFSHAWKWKVKVKSHSRVRLFMIPWAAAYEAPPSMGVPRQEYWSGMPLPSPGKQYGRFLKNKKYGEWNGNPLQYSCLENPMGGGAW